MPFAHRHGDRRRLQSASRILRVTTFGLVGAGQPQV